MKTPLKQMRWFRLVMFASCWVALSGARLAAQQFQQCANYITQQEAEQKYGQRECKCVDLDKVEAFLKNIKGEIGIINDVQQQGSKEDVNSAFKRLLHEEVSIGQIRWNQDETACTPVACEEYVQNNCKSIWMSTFKHEQGHCNWERQNIPKLDWITTPIGSLVTHWTLVLNLTSMNAQEEKAARAPQTDYLNQQIADIKKGCKYKCNINGKLFDTLPGCIAQCPDRRTLGHMDICTQQK